MIRREFRRVTLADLPELEADGWRRRCLVMRLLLLLAIAYRARPGVRVVAWSETFGPGEV